MPKIKETLKGSFTKFFGTVRKKNFRRKIVMPPIMHKIFRYPKFSETLKGCSRNFSALRDKKFSTELSDIRFLCIKFCDARIFLKHRSVPQRNFSVLCDKKFLTENVIPPPSLMHKIFRHPKFFDTLKCSPTNFIGTARQKIFNGV